MMVVGLSKACGVALTPYVCISVLASGPCKSVSDSVTEARKETQHHWVTEAEELIQELLDLAHDTREIEVPDSDYPVKALGAIAPYAKELFEKRDKGHELLWKLWLVTGLPPDTVGQHKSLQAFFRRSASTYQRYVTEHADLTEEEIDRLGLSNAVESFGSPLWYTTLEFLEKKSGFRMKWHCRIHVIPHDRIISSPLPEESYDRLSDALKRWLDANRGRMVWDSRARGFRPHGSYIRTAHLTKVILEANDFRIPQKLVE